MEYADPFMNDPVVITEATPRKHDIFDDIDPPRPTIKQSALEYIDAGLSVVPCALPGKYPPLPWMTYQGEIASADQVARWYEKNPQWGVGFACGEVSGGLEVIDLDGGEFADQYVETVERNMPGLMAKLVMEQSPSGGRHYAYRCAEVGGNAKLAATTAELPGHKRGVDGLTTLIETRGQGGYIVVYPTRGYCLLQGDWRDVPSISMIERDVLFSCAALFDESDKAAPQAADTYQSKKDIKPPKDNDDFADLMQRHGWTLEKKVKDHEEWRRPGKESGVSATWNYIDNSLYIFSSNAAPFQANHRYTFDQIRAMLEPESIPLHERTLTEKFYNTDMGNGKRFMARYREQFKHSEAWGWLRWNGYKWERNADKLVMDAARHTAQMIFTEAVDTNPDESKATGKWAIQSQSKSKLDAMLYLASSEQGIRATPADFDADHYTLNCLNGIIDLRSGGFSRNEPDRMLSKNVNARFDSNATCPRWLSFLDRIMAGNDSMIRFLQRAIGYSLTGSTVEQCFFLNYGTGANGKSVFLETIRYMLNDYASAAEFSAFLQTQSESVRNDIAALAGARFVSANESGADKRLSESIIKAITGGDTISARFLFKEYFEFKPQFKVWMATNHKPVIKDTDHAIWRRVRLVPFNVTIPKAERDPNLTVALRDELSGILNWAIAGCLQWQADGLGEPAEVTEATESYRNEQDQLSSFITAYCVVNERAVYSASKLNKLYCEMTGEKVSAREFNRMMTEHNYRSEHSRIGTVWVGIGPLDTDNAE